MEIYRLYGIINGFIIIKDRNGAEEIFPGTVHMECPAQIFYKGEVMIWFIII